MREMDVRPGGRYRRDWRSAGEGKEFGFHGGYREVDAPRDAAISTGMTDGMETSYARLDTLLADERGG